LQGLRLAHEDACHFEACILQEGLEGHADESLILDNYAAGLSHEYRLSVWIGRKWLPPGAIGSLQEQADDGQSHFMKPVLTSIGIQISLH
jgi:hypothetical protein